MNRKICPIVLKMVSSLALACFLTLSAQQPHQGADRPIDETCLFDNDSMCSQRYKMIRSLLDQYRRPFTLLDIADVKGYYAIQTASHYDAVSVIMEKNPESDQLLDICKNFSNLVFLNQPPTTDALQHLSECEHFDVVVALNFFDQFKDSQQEVLDAILNMGDHMVFEIPQESVLEFKDSVISNGASILVMTPLIESDKKSSICIVLSGKKYLQRKTWLLPKSKKNDYVIDSSFNHKTLTKSSYWPPNATQTSAWIPGINLLTFKMCRGEYPTKETLKNALLLLKEEAQTDWMVNNIVVQGNVLAWVDTDDTSRRKHAVLKPTTFTSEGLQAHYELIDLDDPKQIEHYFWNNLVGTPKVKRDSVKFFGNFVPTASKVFDINTESEQLIDIYLGFGATVISCNLFGEVNHKLAKKFEFEDVIVINRNILEHYGKKATLDDMIQLYGKPKFCNIHASAHAAHAILQGLSQPIAHLAFKFEIQALPELIKCLKRLHSLGYTRFNFSSRDLPRLGFSANPHIGKQENWVPAETLIQEIEQFAKLDSKGDCFWGYVHARYIMK